MAKAWKRSEVSVESGGTTDCKIWNLETKIENESTSFKLVDGLINNITTSNINVWVSAASNDGYLVLNVSGSGGSVISFELEFSSVAPNPIGEEQNTPPSNFKIFLAKVSGGTAISRYCKPLTVQPYISRTEGKVPSQVGEDNNIRHYTWQINEY